MRGVAGFVGVQALVLLVSLRASAQEATPTARPPLLAPPAHLVLSVPEPTSASASAADLHGRSLLVPLELTPPPLLAATLGATPPLHTAEGELSTYVAFAQLVAFGALSLNAQGAVAPKLELDCRATCQQVVEGSLALAAQVVVAGEAQQPEAAVLVHTEQTSTRPNLERRLKVGVWGAF